jgi:hypothetical protein
LACLTTSAAFPFKGNDIQAAVEVDCESINQQHNYDQAVSILRQRYPVESDISIVFDSQQPDRAVTLSSFNNSNDPNNFISLALHGGDIIGIALIVYGLIAFLLGRRAKT